MKSTAKAKIPFTQIVGDIKNKRNEEFYRNIDNFIAQGGDINMTINGKKKYNFLHYATAQGTPEMVHYLLNREARITRSKEEGNTLHIALLADATTDEKRAKIIALLDKASEANRLSMNKDGLTPEVIAVKQGDAGILNVFLEYGIEFQYTNGNHVFSLHNIATQSNNPQAYYDMLALDNIRLDGKKINLAITDDFSGKTCLDYAIENNNPGAARYLLNHQHLESFPKETLASLLKGKEDIDNAGLNNIRPEMYSLINEYIAVYQGRLGVERQTPEPDRSQILESFGSLQSPSHQEESKEVVEEKESGSQNQQSGGGMSLGLKEMSVTAPEYNPEKNEREKAELAAQKKSFWGLFENQATVGVRVDAEIVEKVAKLKKEQTGNEGRPGLAEEIDAKRAQGNTGNTQESVPENETPMQTFRRLAAQSTRTVAPAKSVSTNSKKPSSHDARGR